VFIVEHDANGALGVVLNRPSETTVADVLAPWGQFAAPPAVVFGGGPVAPTTALGLARGFVDDGIDGWQPVHGELGTVDLARDPAELGGGLRVMRVFVGYAGWAPGQLDGEIEAGGWFVVDARPDDVLTPDPHNLWQGVLRRQRGLLAAFATYPDNPTLN